MTPDVIARAFEPFFTTKPIGQGTGLGLSMIYGFARQSDGQVRIYSEPGQGSMVCIYLPRLVGGEKTEELVPNSRAPPMLRTAKPSSWWMTSQPCACSSLRFFRNSAMLLSKRRTLPRA